MVYPVAAFDGRQGKPHMVRDGIALSDDIRNQLIFDPCDLIFQCQFLLFQPSQGQRVRPPCGFQDMHGFVQVAMLTPQNLQPDTEHFFEIQFRGRVHLVLGPGMSRLSVTANDIVILAKTVKVSAMIFRGLAAFRPPPHIREAGLPISGSCGQCRLGQGHDG
jgi:hypothetical protein